ncbi:MAG: hypothetical protein GWO20_04790, partial [Candidatus Korarchaeota archaeon]|nr:hypothetical protein [Candidatus Korarchaeota archaeon]NIU82718.1 hypothetical protein [Candidatus Thorarchaeota archaeon]NIW13209.1 hypothetical protein [Candidatus Thorarchaeota archaeon]NIW51348.1 hypothetical protein [Candidatus Korarchaeota archaeon]
GVTKIDDLHFSRSDKELELMHEIKRVFDPRNILNPGKVIPERRNKQES